MRTLTVARDDTGETRDIRIRPLKKKERKKLADYGYGAMHCLPNVETANDAVEKALETVLSADDLAFLEECPDRESVRAWKELLKETYGDKDEEKNLSATTSGTSTEGESTTAKNAGDSTSNPQPA